MVSLAILDDVARIRCRQAFPETTGKANILNAVYLSACNLFYVLLPL